VERPTWGSSSRKRFHHRECGSNVVGLVDDAPNHLCPNPEHLPALVPSEQIRTIIRLFDIRGFVVASASGSDSETIDTVAALNNVALQIFDIVGLRLCTPRSRTDR
jgi:hypothetical protein